MLGAATPAYSLAVWHGFTLPLLMSLVALGGGVAAVTSRCSGYFARGVDGDAARCRRIDARRVFDAVLVALSWRWARALVRLLGTRRLQPQLRWIVAARVRGGDCGRCSSAASSFGTLPLDRRRSGACVCCGSSAAPARSAPPGRRSFTGSPR